MAPLREALADAALRLDGRDAVPGAAEHCSTRCCPKGLQWYWKGDFVKELPDAAIDAHIEHAAKAPSELSLMHLYPIDGAVHRVRQGRDGLELPRRDLVDGDRRHRSGSREGGRPQGTGARRYWEAVHPFNLGGAYVNFMMDDEGDGRVQGDLRRQLRAARRSEEEVRPGQPLPRQPEHPAGCRAENAYRCLIGGANSRPVYCERSFRATCSPPLAKRWGGIGMGEFITPCSAQIGKRSYPG